MENRSGTGRPGSNPSHEMMVAGPEKKQRAEKGWRSFDCFLSGWRPAEAQKTARYLA